MKALIYSFCSYIKTFILHLNNSRLCAFDINTHNVSSSTVKTVISHRISYIKMDIQHLWTEETPPLCSKFAPRSTTRWKLSKGLFSLISIPFLIPVHPFSTYPITHKHTIKILNYKYLQISMRPCFHLLLVLLKRNNFYILTYRYEVNIHLLHSVPTGWICRRKGRGIVLPSRDPQVTVEQIE